MIFTLMSVSFIIIGVVLLVIGNNKKIDYSIRDNFQFVGAIWLTFSILMNIVLTSLIISNVVNYDLDYQNTLHEKEMIEYRMEHVEDNLTGNEMLYNDIVEFNNKLRSQKKWANNAWTSWFNNKKIAALDYIELDND